MLKCAWYGWRLVSSSDDGFFTNVTPRSCGPAVTVMRAFRFASTLSWPSSFGGRLHGERRHALAVEQHLQLVRLAEALDVLVAVPRQPDLDVVLAVLREGVRDQRCRRACRAAALRRVLPA